MYFVPELSQWPLLWAGDPRHQQRQALLTHAPPGPEFPPKTQTMSAQIILMAAALGCGSSPPAESAAAGSADPRAAWTGDIPQTLDPKP